ncbi:hypothetical protein [Gimesia sp.]|uniref:DUF6946 family protein n=1 Tax=Gimesia sp. TaxID=2024833 RepID=UPI0032EC339E
MKVYGLDFTSAPDAAGSQARKKKRLLLAKCTFQNNVLTVDDFEELNCEKGDFSRFEDWLNNTDGPWIGGVDFPFGQPSQLLEDLEWPVTSWSDYVEHIKDLGKAGFEDALVQYKADKPDGQKHIKRVIDSMTDAHSPMTLDHTPVGKMFFEGSWRLRESDVSVLPVRPVDEATKIVIEAYPALVARKWTSRKPGYKSDDPEKADEYAEFARCDIVSAIRGHDKNNCRPSFVDRYGFTVRMTDEQARQCVNDFTGDTLDSVLSAIQAAWAYSKQDSGYGIPKQADTLEGWICDPETVVTDEGLGVAYFHGELNSIQQISQVIGNYSAGEFNSPTRSTIPMLSLLMHNPTMFNAIVDQLGMPQERQLFLEYKVSSPANSRTKSHTDIMLKSGSDALAIEAKWTEPMYDDVQTWLSKVTNGPAVLNGWLELILKVLAKKSLKAEDFREVIYQMLHRAASAAATGYRPRLAYFLFKPSPDPQSASTDAIKSALTTLWGKLGKPKKFPFYVVEIVTVPSAAYELIRNEPKCEATSEQLKTVLKGGEPLFEFESYSISEIGVD